MPGNLFCPYDKERETRTSCDDRNDKRKTQHWKMAGKDVRWTNKVAKCKTSDTGTKSDREVWKVIIA